MFCLQFIASYDAPFAPDVNSPDTMHGFSAVISEQKTGKIVSPTFRIQIKNPGVAGYLPSSLRYADLWEQRDTDPSPVHLARGRLVPILTGMTEDKIELTFRCLPPNSDDVIKSAADVLRIGEDYNYDPDALPADRLDADYYDPLFYSADAIDDPETALSARPEIWIWNRTSLAVERTHLVESDVTHIIGSQGTDVPPTLEVTNPPKPIMKSRVVAGWTQAAKGKQSTGLTYNVITYTWEDFLSSFPKPGTAIGSNTGWSLAEAEINYVNDFQTDVVYAADTKYSAANGAGLHIKAKAINFTLKAAYDYQQQRQELLTIALPTGLQEIPEEDDQSEIFENVQLTNLLIDGSTPAWEYEDPDTLEIMHYLVDDEVLANGKAWKCIYEHDASPNFSIKDSLGNTVWEIREKRAPLRNLESPRFLDSDRGIRAIRHATLRLARANLERSQCVESTFEIPWLLARQMSCKDSAQIAHHKLPSGELVGKIISLDLQIEENGRRSAKVTIAAIPGTGTALPTPTVDELETGDVVYGQTFASVREPVIASSLRAQSPKFAAFDSDWYWQWSMADGAPDPIKTIGEHPTTFKMYYTPIREEDVLVRRMSVVCSPLSLPKQINLRPDLGG